MKTRILTCIICAVMVSATYSNVALAALGGGQRYGGQQKGGTTPVEPSSEAPPVPAIEVTPEVQPKSLIPSLPGSAPCAADQVPGLWKLKNVYEDPLGSEVSSFRQSPVQYMYFRTNGTFGRHNSSQEDKKPRQVIKEINTHTTGLLQYLVQDSGIMYFYQDKVANDAQSCFMVINPRDDFAAGDMLLMPPKGQIKGRLVKHYSKIGGKTKKEKQRKKPQSRRHQTGYNDQIPPQLEDEM